MALNNLLKKSGHRWRFFRIGGFDQVVLDSGEDLRRLEELDQKLWVALACPTRGLEFDSKTLDKIDTDKDGRIRAPELLAAVKWTCSVLREPGILFEASADLPLAAIDDSKPEGAALLASSRRILINLGKPEATTISLEDALDTVRIFANTRFNGDGVVCSEASDAPAVRTVIADMVACVGGVPDRSGAMGVSAAKVAEFYAAAQAFSDWHRQAEEQAAAIMPLGAATAGAAAALAAVRGKVDDYFTRCRLAAFDSRAVGVLNRAETEYAALAGQDFSAGAQELAGFPLARIVPDQPLPLRTGLNPAWHDGIAALRGQVVVPLLGERDALTVDEWQQIKAKLAPFAAWNAAQGGAAVAKLGLSRVREILAGDVRAAVEALIAQDAALAPEADAIASVEKLLRFRRDLVRLLANFVSFADFYSKAKAIFQAGTLYLDGRSCELCSKVANVAAHATLAPMSMIYLAYCDCVRNGGAEKMTIAAAFTGGDADYLMAGRNGIFYDRQGRDWDATITKVVEQPISVRQAFWRPYKRFGKFVSDQIAKFAAGRDEAVQKKAEAGAVSAGQASGKEGSKAAPAFDVAKFAGIFAAIGLALGALGTAVAAIVTGLLKLPVWQLPLVVVGLIVVISGPSMLMALLKLRQRNLGPLLDAEGWAVNARARINIPFGGSLTSVAKLPEGADRSLADPYAEKKSPWPKVIVVLAVLAIALWVLNSKGKIYEWTGGRCGHQVVVESPVVGEPPAGDPPPVPAAPAAPTP